MKAIIIEDEKKIAQDLKKMLKKVQPEMEVMAVLESIDASVAWLQNNASPDLIFMDIQLADGLSFQIFSKVKINCPVIFCTAYDKYALDAFKSNGIDYLLKPVNEEMLAESLGKMNALKNHFSQNQELITEIISSIKKSNRSYRTSYLISYKSKMLPVPVANIVYFIITEGQTTLYTKDGDFFTINKNLEELENELDPKIFFRANRQYLIAYPFIKEAEHYLNRKLEVLLTCPVDEPIIVSKEKATEFLSWMENR
jgi:DNA-binding LytR/AlgR family response regulator